ncbi:hypothetical protein BDF20DRAFT_845371 [Mycotypha africana]|uniref:uncharacterized protein n=1 Tax=Mycotypha africana TaxID=64632 RepID=UPI00230130EB|nr:uncharacterized protein BDF20DRAFT_845371 [Mycotypha africana]KAI8991581.1 hypothetical protein BDF20DRAFT_845371 [Mycotypha africana]
MQQENKWTSPPDTPRNYMSLQSSYPYSNNSNDFSTHPATASNASNVLPGMSSQPAIPGLISGSQPSTPRPDIISPPPDNNKIATPDLIRRRPPLPSKPASFTTTTFHSNPYPSGVALRRRRTESSMFSFETGPAFSPTKQTLDLWNIDQSNGYQVQLQAKMDRGFFRADQDWTCYRRNYFQVSSVFELHGMNYMFQGPEVPCLVKTENQELYQVDYFSIGVTARVSGSDKKIELVQHTPKRDKGPQMIPEPRVVSVGGNLHLASVGSNHNIVTFERLQFKTATANNGKRRAAQQYYEIVISLYANSSTTGKQFKVATTVSAPLVVRGRSPGHYADSHTRYRSLDAGTPSGVGAVANVAAVNAAAAAVGHHPPPPPPPFSMVGPGGPSGNTSTNTPPLPPLNGVATASAIGIAPSGSDPYLHQQQQSRYAGLNAASVAGPNDFHAYPYHHPQTPTYPYPLGYASSVLNTPPLGLATAGNRHDEQQDPHQHAHHQQQQARENSYMVHPYASQQHHQHNSGHFYTADNSNSNHHSGLESNQPPSGDYYGHQQQHPSSTEHHRHHQQHPYWTTQHGDNRDTNTGSTTNAAAAAATNAANTAASSEHNARFAPQQNSNGNTYLSSDFHNSYGVRPQQHDANNTNPSSTLGEATNPLDADRSMVNTTNNNNTTINNNNGSNRHYMHHSSTVSH